MRSLSRLILIVTCVCLVTFAAAQQPITSSGDLTYDFESGVSFGVPSGWVLDYSGAVPNISPTDGSIIVELVEPGVIGVTAEDTAGAPLTAILDYLLGLVGFTGQRSAEQTETFALLDGREIVAFGFTNSSGDEQTVLVMRFSNTQVGAMNVRSDVALTGEQQRLILAVANSFDQKPLDPQAAIDQAEAALTEGFSDPVTLASGVSFRYPEGFTIEDPTAQFPVIGVPNQMIITMVDPNAVSLPAGETMEDIAAFAVRDADIDPADFQPLDIGGREARYASGPSGQLTQTLVLVRFDDDTVGIMDVATLRTPTAEQLLHIRGVAASFNSASAEFTGVTREAADQARALFEQAMDARDAGDLEAALPLFDQALESDPGLALAHYWRAATYQDQGKLEEALDGYLTALSLEPDEASIRTDISRMYVLLDDLESAAEQLQLRIDAQGSSPNPDLVNELELYRQLIDGEYVEMFYVNRAAQYLRFGLYDLAIADLELTIERSPSNPLLYARLGVVYDSAGEYRQAVDTFTAGLRLDELPVLYFNRGYAYQRGFREISNAIVLADNDLRCAVLLGEGDLTDEQITTAQRSIDSTIISSDDYQPITDPAQCEP